MFRKIYRDFDLEDIVKYVCKNGTMQAVGLQFYTADQRMYLAQMDLLSDDMVIWWTWKDELSQLRVKVNLPKLDDYEENYVNSLYGEEFYDYIRDTVIKHIKRNQ